MRGAKLLASFLVLLVAAAGPTRGAADRIDFNFQIRPLLSDRCYTCHGPDEKGRKAKLRLDTVDGLKGKTKSGRLIVAPGNRTASDLWQRIITQDPDELMPPPDSHLKLTAAEVEVLGKWIDQGAEFRKHWAFNPLERIEVPQMAPADGIRNEIDAFVRSRLKAQQLKPGEEAPRAQWLRRVSLDLIGLPPTLAEIDAFVADGSTEAYEHVVDRLLASPAFGERMASEWMDLARYADTYGYQADVDRDMSPWRDWVIRAINDNLPYDQFILWQLAGDLLPNPTRDQYLATAFNRLHRQTNEGGSIEDEFRTEYVADRVHTVGTTFLGLTLECSRCHDHKYDPVSQKDYYRMFAFFNNIDESGLYSHFTQATPTPTLLLYANDQERQHAEARAAVVEAEGRLAETRRQAEARFQQLPAEQRGRAAVLPTPVASFAFDEMVTNRFLNQADPARPASVTENPAVVAGFKGQAVRFSGDDSVVCKGVGHFKRTDAFTIDLRVRPTELQARAVLLHHSRSWTDSGSRGYEVVLENGRPQFALIHFWPGNAIAIRARESLPLRAWSRVTLTYDGSSRAKGMKLYLDGKEQDCEVVRDNLFRDIQHRAEWGDAETGGLELTLGARFRDNGFRRGEVDELRVWNTDLSPAEVLAAGTVPALDAPFASGVEEYVRRQDDAVRQALAAVKQARETENELVTKVREIMVMKELEKRRQAYVLRRGSYQMPADPVEPGVPEGIMPMPAGLPQNRLGFAKWMIDPGNPLTARVAVNRIWRAHFGRGLVATAEDFGAQGQLPTHPELLDWLAKQFIDRGWDRKAMHRLVVLSATYRQSSQASRELLAADPENRWLARGPKHRLAAEQIRDQALAVSGLLVKQVGGPSVKPYQPPGVWEDSGTGKSYRQDKGDKLYRRSLYTFWRRTAPPPSMLSFDATSREVCTAKREVTSTPLQSLVLLNDVQFLEASRVLAETLSREFPADLAGRVASGFRRLTGREPEPKEREILLRLFNEQRAYYAQHAAEAEKLLSSGEKPRDPQLATADLAATTLVVSTLMNHDEFVIKR